MSPTYVYQLEQGLKSPTVAYLEYICFGLDMTLEQFFLSELPIEDRINALSERQRDLLNEFLKSLL